MTRLRVSPESRCSGSTAGQRYLLSPREVETADDGDYPDGGGLILRVRGGMGSWVHRYTSPAGKRREMGLGKLDRSSAKAIGKSMTDARDAAEDARRLLREKIDPIEHRDAERARAAQALEIKRAETKREQATLARVAREYHAKVIEPHRTPKHAHQWLQSLELHVPDTLWHKPIADVTGPEVLDFVTGLQAKIPETAARVRQRLEAIFDDAEFRGVSTGNPARAIRRKLRETKKGRARGSFAALPFAKAPAFLTELRKREGISARALEFAMLTAARTGEVIGATWDEFDLQAGVWTVPATRMKGGEPHAVFLSQRAREIVESMRELGQGFVFPSPELDGAAMSNMAMLTLLRRMDKAGETTVHGLCRATFSTWAYETAAARPDVIEACLAHRESDRVKAAYNRAQFTTERAALLAAWADYLEGRARASNVHELRPSNAAA